MPLCARPDTLIEQGRCDPRRRCIEGVQCRLPSLTSQKTGRLDQPFCYYQGEGKEGGMLTLT